MNNLKKIISGVLAIVTVFSLASCGKADKKDTEATTTTKFEEITSIEDNKKEIEATANSAEKATASEKTSVVTTTKKAQSYLVAEKKDKTNLTDLMTMVVGYGREYVSVDPDCGDEGYTEKQFFDINYKDYDCKSKDAFKDAFLSVLGVPYYNLFNYYAEDYGWDLNSIEKEYFYSNEKDAADSVRDPLKKFPLHCSYLRIDGEKFDFILKNAFNVTPDHSYVLHDKNSRWFPDEDSAYYYNGYYYVCKGNGGDGAGPKTVIQNMERQADGKYKINISYQYGNDFEGYEEISKLNVVAGLKNVNGDRLWSIDSIKRA